MVPLSSGQRAQCTATPTSSVCVWEIKHPGTFYGWFIYVLLLLLLHGRSLGWDEESRPEAADADEEEYSEMR